MSVYSLSLLGGVPTSNLPAMDLQSEGSSSKILEVTVSNNTAVASGIFGLGRAGNGSSAVQLAPTYLLSEGDLSVSVTTSCATAWTVVPTVPAQMFRRVTTLAGLNAGAIWTFPRGLRLDNGFSMVVWNILTSSSSYFITWIIDE